MLVEADPDSRVGLLLPTPIHYEAVSIASFAKLY